MRSNKKIIASRYKVKQEIVGGMGIVYLCSDLNQGGHPVVLKTCHPRYNDDRNLRAQFLREAATWVEIGWHPNLVQAYRAEYDYTTQTIYLVIEMVPPARGNTSPTLASMLADQKRLEIEKALLILLDIVRGMKYATSKIPGLIHCDLKPENIFIGLDGRACVSDFGLVCTPGDIHESLSRSVPKYINNRSRPVGTPYYMSPERWRNRRVGVSADIYSLGCMFLEMLTGEHAVQGETVKALIEAHIRGEAITKAKGLSLPKTTSMFLCRCLEPDPKYRYQTWEEVETGLERMHEILLKRPAPRDTILYDVSKKGQVVLGETWFSIGEAHLDIREFRAALACFEKAREIGKAQNHSPLVALAEANIGLTYFKLGQPERGAVHYRRAAAQQERFAEGDTVKPTLAPGEEFSQTRQFG